MTEIQGTGERGRVAGAVRASTLALSRALSTHSPLQDVPGRHQRIAELWHDQSVSGEPHPDATSESAEMTREWSMMHRAVGIGHPMKIREGLA